MLTSNYTEEEEVEKISFPCIGYRSCQGYTGKYAQIVLFHNVTSGMVLFSTNEEETGKYSDKFNFLNFQEFKGSVTITNK